MAAGFQRLGGARSLSGFPGLSILSRRQSAGGRSDGLSQRYEGTDHPRAFPFPKNTRIPNEGESFRAGGFRP